MTQKCLINTYLLIKEEEFPRLKMICQLGLIQNSTRNHINDIDKIIPTKIKKTTEISKGRADDRP
jgi:hypothetical protein